MCVGVVCLHGDDWSGLEWANGGGRVGVVCLHGDDWSGLEWASGGRVGVIDCMNMIVMD